MVKVVKFGGSSLASAEQFAKVGKIIHADKERRYVVPSAPGKRNSKDTKVTDMLYACYDLVEKDEDFRVMLMKIKDRYDTIINGLNLKLSLEEEFKKISENFKNKAITLMTTSNLEKDNNCIFRLKNDKKISYIGNLGYNRWKALIDIGRLVKEISNGEMNIDVYSSESRSEIIKHLNFENGISFRGSLDAKQVIEKINDSDVLIHVESLDSVNREKVKYSISTKIADMLSSGKYLLIYGPKEVASIEYFSENNAALVSTSKEQLRKNIKLLINDHYESEYINNALSLSEKNHSKEKNDKILKKFVEFTKNNWES